MVNYSYQKGYRFERRVLKKLESLGYWCARQGKSAFPDLICLKGSSSFLGECKSWKKIPKDPLKQLSSEEISKAYKIANKSALPFLLFYNDRRRIKIIALGGRGTLLASDLELEVNARNTGA